MSEWLRWHLYYYSALFLLLKKSIEEEKKPIQELNNSIIRLNINFENMLANDKIRDERIGNHGKEIDKLENRVLRNRARIKQP